MNSQTTTPRRPYGRRVALYFVLFFGTIIAVNALMATLAVRTNAGVVTDHAYEKGLAYNQVVAAEKAQEALGWKGELAYAGGMLTFTLRDKQGHMLAYDSATATITRPTQAGMDFTATLTSAGNAVTFPAKGLWHVKVDALYHGTSYQHATRLVIP